MDPSSVATAVAHSNIALIKYWGKVERSGNYPAVPSLSLTLDKLTTTTRCEAIGRTQDDLVIVNGIPQTGDSAIRVTAALDRLRASAGVMSRMRVESTNNFPTAAGLASSASGFAALTLAAAQVLGLSLASSTISSLARAASASAARSVFGGWAALEVGADSAEPVAPADHWDLALLVAITTTSPKSMGSTMAMNHTRATSPYYPAWLSLAPKLYEQARRALLSKDLEQLGSLMEQSTLSMHATMLAAHPSVLYFSPVTLAVMEEIREARRTGTLAYLTMDAGPQVKVLCLAPDAPLLKTRLRQVPGVAEVIDCRPGPDAHLIPNSPREAAC